MKGQAIVARAPGRVNLIGDHTDYTGGLCLPMAIDRWVEVAGKRDPTSGVVALRSDAMSGEVAISIDGTQATTDVDWGRYVAAIVRRLVPVHGFAGVVRSDLPIGAGLSSSAALEVATALALGADGLDPSALAMLCRDAEYDARGIRPAYSTSWPRFTASSTTPCSSTAPPTPSCRSRFHPPTKPKSS